MSHSGSHADTVRELIHNQFKELGYAENQPFLETFLIHGGHFCGRRFRQGDGYAIWLIDENSVTFYGNDGEELLVIMPAIEVTSHRRAAGA